MMSIYYLVIFLLLSTLISGLESDDEMIFRLRNSTDLEDKCEKRSPIDVNLGSDWISFINAAYCQVFGNLPSESVYSSLKSKEMHPRTRRIDIIRSFCQEANNPSCSLSYSDPWENGEMELKAPKCK